MPSIEISYETRDGIVEAGLRDLLNAMVDGYRDLNTHPDDKEKYADDIRAIEHVLKIYGA
jgi:hypothetical protein